MLDSSPKSGPYIPTRADGRPWFTEKNDKEMGKAFREHMKDAGLYHADPKERLHFNDLRGTAVTLLAEAGCTVPEIVFDHRTYAAIGNTDSRKISRADQGDFRRRNPQIRERSGN